MCAGLDFPAAAAQDIYLVYELMDTDLHQIVRSRQDLTEQHLQWFVYQARSRRRRPSESCTAVRGAPPWGRGSEWRIVPHSDADVCEHRQAAASAAASARAPALLEVSRVSWPTSESVWRDPALQRAADCRPGYQADAASDAPSINVAAAPGRKEPQCSAQAD